MAARKLSFRLPTTPPRLIGLERGGGAVCFVSVSRIVIIIVFCMQVTARTVDDAPCCPAVL